MVAVATGGGRAFTRGCSIALTEDIFGVLGRWSPAAGDRTWKFDCIITLPGRSLHRRHYSTPWAGYNAGYPLLLQ